MAAVVALMLPGRGCGTGTPAPAAAARPTAAPGPDLFLTSVRPMLVQKCAPCHEPGGKLYGKLPFDDPGVVAGHAPGMMKRLKGEDRAILENWIATLPDRATPNPPASPGGRGAG